MPHAQKTPVYFHITISYPAHATMSTDSAQQVHEDSLGLIFLQLRHSLSSCQTAPAAEHLRSQTPTSTNNQAESVCTFPHQRGPVKSLGACRGNRVRRQCNPPHEDTVGWESQGEGKGPPILGTMNVVTTIGLA